MKQILENIEAGRVSSEMARRGIQPRQRVRVVFEPVEDDDVSLAALAKQGGAFDWLHDEPDIYTMADVKNPNV